MSETDENGQPTPKEQERTIKAKEAVLLALEKTLGVVTTACKNADVSRSQFYKWMNEDEVFVKAVEDMENVALDFVETQLHKQIQDGIPSSTIFYLKSKGKKRGYIEREERIIKVGFSNVSDEELDDQIREFIHGK